MRPPRAEERRLLDIVARTALALGGVLPGEELRQSFGATAHEHLRELCAAVEGGSADAQANYARDRANALLSKGQIARVAELVLRLDHHVRPVACVRTASSDDLQLGTPILLAKVLAIHGELRERLPRHELEAADLRGARALVRAPRMNYLIIRLLADLGKLRSRRVGGAVTLETGELLLEPSLIKDLAELFELLDPALHLHWLRIRGALVEGKLQRCPGA